MINVLHLYYDLLNLYGENANLRAIVHNLELNNIKVKVDLKTINDQIDFEKYDIIYIGQGSEENLLLALNDILKRRKDLINYIDNDKYMFLTGNAMCLFGSKINDNKSEIDALNIFDYKSNYLTKSTFKNASSDRIVGEVICTTNLIKHKIIGFQNRCDIISDIDTPIFKTDIKYSNDGTNNNEGFNYKNVYATHLIGPLFIRNPYLLDYFLKKVCESKNLKYESLDKTAINAYKKYLSNFN